MLIISVDRLRLNIAKRRFPGYNLSIVRNSCIDMSKPSFAERAKLRRVFLQLHRRVLKKPEKNKHCSFGERRDARITCFIAVDKDENPILMQKLTIKCMHCLV